MDRETRSAADLQVGQWRIDAQGDELLRGDERVKLEPRLMRLLLVLARRPGETVSAETLLAEVWSDVVVTPDSVYQAVAKLRRALQDDSAQPAYIVTVPRRGYRLVAPVQAMPVTLQPGTAGGTREAARDAAAAPARRATDRPQAAPGAAADGATTGKSSVGVYAPRFSLYHWLGLALGAATIGIGAFVLSRDDESVPPPPAAMAPSSVVVLPFDDASEARSDAVFVAGLSADVAAAVERVRGLRVAAHGAAVALARQKQSLAEIGRRLEAGQALRGQVSRRGDSIAVAVELVDAANGTPRWSQRFERSQVTATTLAEEIAAGVASALQLEPAARAPSTRSFAAYEAFVTGGHFLREATPESIAKARDYFQRAIDLDPAFARAYAAQALAWMADWKFSGTTLRDAAARAQPLIDRALALEPDSALAQGVQGFILLEQLQLQRAAPYLQRALERNPNDFNAHLWSGLLAAYDGRPRDAVPHYERAAQLDPTRFLVPVLLGVESSHVAAYETARRHFEAAIAMAPEHPNGPWGLGILAYAQGRLDEAALAYERALALNPKRFDLWRQLAWIFLDLGLPGEALVAFGRAARIAPNLPYLHAEAALANLIDGDDKALQAKLAAVGDQSPVPPDALAHLALLNSVQGDAARGGALAQQATALIAADPLPHQGPWEVFLGHHLPLDLAAALHGDGLQEAARPLLEQSRATLERLQAQNVWHSLEFLAARVHALQGRPAEALAALERAALLGFRRGWWLLHDPALRPLRGEPRFEALRAGLAQTSATQRRDYLARRAEAATAAASAGTADNAGKAAPAGRDRVALVLWVDDRPSNNARERESLAALGLRFVLATSTELALEETARQSFALIISDMGRGPDLRAGYTLLKSLRDRGDRTPLLFYTSSCTEAQMAEARRADAVGCAAQISDLMKRSLAVLELPAAAKKAAAKP